MSDGILYAIDPGLRAAGWARFDDGVLVYCGCAYADVGKGPEQYRAMAAEIESFVSVPDAELAIEQMEPRKNKPEAFTALIQLTLISGMVAGRHQGELRMVLPSKWTGRFEKDINHRRIRKRLDKTETTVLKEGLKGVHPDNHKEVLDAVGIGLYVKRRLR